MKLFVKDKKGKKIYVSPVVDTRTEFAQQIGGPYFQVDGQWYEVAQVKAEPSTNDTAIGAITGSLLGAVLVPAVGAGVFVGSLLGGLVGSVGANSEFQRVQRFNNSQYGVYR